jgi:transglutaminase-like putative cysteine protease
MFYAIRHFTRYRYSHLVWQSMMEVRMHPRSEGNQRCFVFQLSVNPRARIFGYTDSYGNLVHHFDLPTLWYANILSGPEINGSRPPDRGSRGF